MADVLAAVTGVFLFGVLLILIYRELNKEDHKMIRYFLLGMIFLSALFIPKLLLDDSDFCSVKPVNATVTGSLTEYDYDHVCFDNPNNTNSTFFRFALITLSVCVFGWLVYLVKYLAVKIKEWVEK